MLAPELGFRTRWQPSVPCRLKDKGVGRDGEWGSLLGKPPLLGASAEDSATLSHLLSLFVQRHWLLWKVGAGVLDWRDWAALSRGCCSPAAGCASGLERWHAGRGGRCRAALHVFLLARR